MLISSSQRVDLNKAFLGLFSVSHIDRTLPDGQELQLGLFCLEVVRIWTGRDEIFLTDCWKPLQSFKDSLQKSHQASTKVQGNISHTSSRVAHSLPRVLGEGLSQQEGHDDLGGLCQH